ncbi:hypothetical protein [Frankia sp. R82]|uniref:hypothetical protein n=1 Tax=Frankia sp. R82 TaxID=2950553 RepID=UPI002044A7EA|nr:hypothetical protein [Frankia sp. R82]MCM3884668.1 hypothetical protein [Frankia sp. R82]
MAQQQRRGGTCTVETAMALLAGAPYASLAGWDGRVAHGLRFTTELVPAASGTPSDSVAAPWLSSGVSPAHPVAGSSASLEREVGLAPPVGVRVVLLAPRTFVAGLARRELVARLNLCGWAPGSRRWVSVAFGGWASQLSDTDRHVAAVHFAQRHPTDDLLDLDAGWALLQMDVGEVVVRTNRECLQLGRIGAIGLLLPALHG